jgi:hypothetical protein
MMMLLSNRRDGRGGGLVNSGASWCQRYIDSPFIVALFTLLVSLCLRTSDLAVFVGPDEFYWVSGCTNFAQAIATGRLEETYHAGQPGVTLMEVETIGFWIRYGTQWLAGAADWNTIVSADQTMEVLGKQRLVAAIANAMLVVVTVLLVYRLFGSGAAWLTAFLLSFSPFLLTEARVVRTEGLMAGFSSIALLISLLYLNKPRLRYCGLAGFLTGLGLLSKITALALIPAQVLVIGYAVLIKFGDTSTNRWRELASALLTWGGALLLTCVILWPALWVAPLDVFHKMYDFTFLRAVVGDGRVKSFFFGTPYQDPGPFFYPVVLLYRSSPRSRRFGLLVR